MKMIRRNFKILPPGHVLKQVPAKPDPLIRLAQPATFVRADIGMTMHLAVPSAKEERVTLCLRIINARYSTLTEREARRSLVCPDCARIGAKRGLIEKDPLP